MKRNILILDVCPHSFGQKAFAIAKSLRQKSQDANLFLLTQDAFPFEQLSSECFAKIFTLSTRALIRAHHSKVIPEPVSFSFFYKELSALSSYRWDMIISSNNNFFEGQLCHFFKSKNFHGTTFDHGDVPWFSSTLYQYDFCHQRFEYRSVFHRLDQGLLSLNLSYTKDSSTFFDEQDKDIFSFFKSLQRNKASKMIALNYSLQGSKEETSFFESLYHALEKKTAFTPFFLIPKSKQKTNFVHFFQSRYQSKPRIIFYDDKNLRSLLLNTEILITSESILSQKAFFFDTPQVFIANQKPPKDLNDFPYLPDNYCYFLPLKNISHSEKISCLLNNLSYLFGERRLVDKENFIFLNSYPYGMALKNQEATESIFLKRAFLLEISGNHLPLAPDKAHISHSIIKEILVQERTFLKKFFSQMFIFISEIEKIPKTQDINSKNIQRHLRALLEESFKTRLCHIPIVLFQQELSSLKTPSMLLKKISQLKNRCRHLKLFIESFFPSKSPETPSQKL